MSFQDKLVDRFIQSPKHLFLVDGIGAAVSAILLGLVLTRFESFFGIPINVLYLLAAIPCFFAFYDLLGYIGLFKNQMFIRLIAFANIAYCLLSLGLAFSHIDKLLIPGWLYLIGEILIVTLLASIELKTAKKLVSA